LIRWLVLSLLIFPFLSGGFDGWAMLAIAVSTAFLAEGRPAGWWAAAAGMAIKLTPGAAWIWARTSWKAAVAALAAGVAATFGPLLWSRGGNADFLGFSLHRGAQIESVPASIAIALTSVLGHNPIYVERFKALEVTGASVETAITAALGIAALGCIAWRAKRVDPWLAAFVTMLVVLGANKVFSPQYIAWAAPLAAVLGGWWFGGYVVMAVVTAAPYTVLVETRTTIVGCAEVRNAVLIVMIAAGLAAVARAQPAAQPGAQPGAVPEGAPPP